MSWAKEMEQEQNDLTSSVPAAMPRKCKDRRPVEKYQAGPSTSRAKAPKSSNDSTSSLGSEIPVQRPRRERKPVKKYQAGQAKSIVRLSEPTKYEEAVKCCHSAEWREAMDTEMRSRKEKETWILVKRPVHAQVLKNRCVYKIKTLPEGDVTRFKARLVVKSYAQREGVDFADTFAPVCRYETLRILLAMAVANDWDSDMFDVDTAFLNSKLKRRVYTEQPEGYAVGLDLVCLVLRAIWHEGCSPSRV
jgi:hypothetical protein